MADSIVLLFTISTLMSVACLILVFLVSWQYESMFLELTRINQGENVIGFKRTGIIHDNNRLKDTEIVKGVSFTRWGYGECPKDTELVYNGRMVAQLSNASIPQCFPLNPTYPSEINRIQRQEVIPKTDEEHYSVSCAVCYSTRHSTVLMLPGRHTCTSGWTVLYEGLLVVNEASSLCMDNASRSLQEPHTRTMNGYHHVKASCDVLPCPPYDDKSNLACVVCIK